MLIPDAIDWIFFDCFNTLIDDFDETGDELGIVPMYRVSVDVGLYDDHEAFRLDYHRWRKDHISGQAQEQSIQQRLQNVLQTYRPHSATEVIDQAVQLMVAQFTTCYPKTLRLPAGVRAMLAHWQGKVRMGVVSNFFLPQWPEKFLNEYGLRENFEFVLDSAACGWRKPGAEIYQAALTAAGSPDPQRVLFVGDHLRNDVLAPLDLGMHAIHFDRSQERPNRPSAPTEVRTIQHWDQFR